MSTLLSVQQLVKQFRGVRASDGIDFDVRPGEIHAVIGPNGAGKTTFINQLAGEITPDAGAIEFRGKDITRLPVHQRAHLGLARSYQISELFNELTLLENVMTAVQARSGHAFRFLRNAGRDQQIVDAGNNALALVGLGDLAGRQVADLAHGQRRQLELAIVMALKPALMLLDEPMAGTGPGESKEIVALLHRLKTSSAIVLIEHDLEAVFALADRISVLVYGKVIASGTAAEIRRNPVVREAYIGDEEAVL